MRIATVFLLGLGILPLQAEPPAAEPPPLRVTEGVTPPRKISGEAPVYTEIARTAGLQGVVVIEAIIDDKGDITNARILHGQPLGLDQQALNAVKTWKFQPAVFEGRPVKVYYNLTVNFRVDRATSHGPVFKGFLRDNPRFAADMKEEHYDQAAQELKRLTAERPGDPTVQIGWFYLFLEQGRLQDARQAALAYQGPGTAEIFQRLGAVAWNRARSDKDLDVKARAELVEMGLDAETRALEAQDDSLEAMFYKTLLLQEKLKATADPAGRQALEAEIEELKRKALELPGRPSN